MNSSRGAWLIALGMIIAAAVFGIFFYIARDTDDTIRVVGYATQEFEANLVKWSFTISERTSLDGAAEGYLRLNRKLEDFKKMWKRMDLQTEEFLVQPINSRDNYDRNGNIVGKTLSQNISIISKDIDEVGDIAVNPMAFAREGIVFDNSDIQYFSTRLDDIKKELLGKATENARQRAEEIAGSAGSIIKNIKSARAGVFQITEPYSTDISSYGIHRTSTRKKMIRVTVSSVFAVEGGSN